MMQKIPRILLSVFCLLFAILAQAQDKKISGTVKDENGIPLSQATVSVKNSLLATTTDANGKFTIDVPATAKILVVSYVGMQSTELPVNATDFNVKLISADSKLNEVVVVGYGTSKRANLTTAQTSVGAKEIDKTVNTTVEQALQGRAAGVYVTQNTGQPGGGLSVNIRGISSLGATQPLYVIDGVQMQDNSDVNFSSTSSSNSLLNGLNPSDIEDIQILQGPSATAIYGSRGTNGVVLITTKRGKNGDVKINYGYQYSLQTPPKSLDVMNLREYAQMVNEYHALAGGTTPGELLDPSLLGEGTDWQKELFNNAPMNKHQLSLSGGGNNTTYYLSGEYLKQEGVAAGSGFDRYGFRLNLDNKPRKWATIGVNLSFNNTKENLAATNYGDAASPLIANALRLTPQIPVTNFDGSWGGSDPINGANQYAPINPIALANLITNTNDRKQFLGGLNLGINLWKGLVFRTSLNANVGQGNSIYYTPTYNIDQWHYNTLASLNNNTYQSWYWNWNQMLEYNNQFGKHNVGLMVSHESQESKYKALSAGRTGFLTNDIFDVNAGDPLSATNGGGTYPWSMESYLGRVSYNYDNRYLLTGTFRRDGSPNFGSENRWGNFPSLSVAWRVSQESFFDVSFISELKIRFETGLTGNQGPGSGIYAPLNTGATPWGTGFLPSTFTNQKLAWEETKTPYNFGLNLGMFRNRLSIEADYYKKDTKNLLLTASLPWYMGTNNSPGSVGAPLINAGSLSTNGWNLTINSTNISKKDFKWETNFNISQFKTEIVGLTSENAFIERSSWWLNNWTQRADIGQQPWLFRGYIQEGIFQSVEEINASAVPVDGSGNRWPTNAQNGIWVGDAKYKDINGDGIIDVNDVTNIGNPWPKFTGGLTNTFSYKGIELSILITGTYGNDVYNYIAAANSNPNNINLSRNLLLDAMDYAKLSTDNGKVTLVNPGTNVPRMSSNSVSNDNNFSRNTSRFVEDGSYTRLKNVSLSYSLPDRLLARTKIIKGLRATVSGQNLFTLTNYSGYDPEVGAYVGTGSSSTNQAIGLDFGRYPLTRIYTIGLSVNF